jgi:distribution and morphology protein 10
VLDFGIPFGVSVHASKQAAELLQASHAFVTLPQLSGTIGYLFSSVPLQGVDAHHVLQHAEWSSRLLPPHDTPALVGRPFVLYGRLFAPSGTLEGMGAVRWSPRTLGRAVFVHALHGDKPSFASVHVHNDGGWHTSEAAYSTEDRLLGLKALVHLSPTTLQRAQNHDESVGRWSMGGEVLYTFKERSGGASLALRYVNYAPRVFEAAATWHPILGHLSLSHTCFLGVPSGQGQGLVVLATRYDFNVFSYESDLSAGIEYRSPTDGAFKLRYGVRRGLALLLDGTYRSAQFSFGVRLDPTDTPTRLVRTVGLSIHYAL